MVGFFRTGFKGKTMSYSDEPNVVTEGARSRKVYFLIGAGFLLFFALLASVALYPKIHEYRREHTPDGPHGGSLYSIKLEGEPFALELARPEAFDYHLSVFLEPENADANWQPEEYSVVFGVDEAEPETLEWDPEREAFGPSAARFHPMADYQFDLKVKHGEETVWSDRLWSFRIEAGAHAH